MLAVADASLGGKPVVAVLHPPGLDDLVGAVPLLQRELHEVDAVAGADLIEQSLGIVEQDRCAVEVAIDVAEKACLGHSNASDWGKSGGEGYHEARIPSRSTKKEICCCSLSGQSVFTLTTAVFSA